MRRHVLRVRRGGRDLGVFVRGGDPALGERLEVVSVDDVVRKPGMRGLLLVDGLENRAGLELSRVTLVGVIDRFEQGERVEDRRLLVLRILARELFHRPLVAFAALRNRSLVVVLVDDLKRVQPVALALGLRERLALLDRFERALEILFGPGRHQGIPPLADRKPPVRHRAPGIGLDHGLERLDVLGKEERVQHRHGALELRLHGRAARSREIHLAELALAATGGRIVFVSQKRPGE